MSASANLTGDLPLDQREGFYSGPRLKGFGVRQRRTATARKVALCIFWGVEVRRPIGKAPV